MDENALPHERDEVSPAEAVVPSAARCEAPAVPAGPTAAAVAELLLELRDRFALDRFREEQVARLHSELQSYREDRLGQVVRQVLRELIDLHDALGKAAAAWQRKPADELTPERLHDLLDGFRDDVEIALARHGVVPYRVPGDDFDPHRQTALCTVAAPEPGAAGKVAERLRPGFEQGTALLQKERVTVYTDRGPGGDHSSRGQS